MTDRVRDRGRRRFVLMSLRALGMGMIVPGMAAVSGCPSSTAGRVDGPLRLDLSELEPGARLRVMHGERPVEVRRTPDGVEARSLFCTHRGCEVRWEPERGVYSCPCHDAFFDAEGRVVSGPPTRPLRNLPVVVTGNEVVIDG